MTKTISHWGEPMCEQEAMLDAIMKEFQQQLLYAPHERLRRVRENVARILKEGE